MARVLLGERGVEPWSYLKFLYLKKVGWKGLVDGLDSGVYKATPLSRLNAAEGMRDPQSPGPNAAGGNDPRSPRPSSPTSLSAPGLTLSVASLFEFFRLFGWVTSGRRSTISSIDRVWCFHPR